MDALTLYFLAIAFISGAIVGSFANVLIERVPEGRSILSPRSSCPNCGAPIAWYDNIPLLSWLALKGRCRSCSEPISARYLLVESVSALLWFGVIVRFGASWAVPAFVVFVTVLVALSAIDLRHRRLPNAILGPATILGAVLVAVAVVADGEWGRGLDALIGVVAYGLPMLGLGLAFPKGMGGGDIKLAGYLGLHLGYLGLLHVLLGAFLGFISGGVIGVVLLLAGRKGRKDPIPFGPHMALGALVALLWGEPLLSLWLV